MSPHAVIIARVSANAREVLAEVYLSLPVQCSGEFRLFSLDVAVTLNRHGMIYDVRPYPDGDVHGLLRRIAGARRRLREEQS